MVLMKFGFEADINFQFKPLRALSQVEEENVKTARQNRYVQLYDRSLLSSQELGEIAEKEKLIPIKTAAEEGLLDDHPGPAAGEEGDPDGGKAD